MRIKKPLRPLRKPRQIKPNVKQLARSAALAAAVVGLIGGMAYALLLRTPTAYVGQSTVRTAKADLLISADGSNYSRSVPGFVFDNAISGGDPVPTVEEAPAIYLKNAGSLPLKVGLSVGEGLVNSANIDLSKVHVLTWVDNGTQFNNFRLSELVSAKSIGGIVIDNLRPLEAGEIFKVAFQIQLEDGAAPQDSTLNNLTFEFDATTL